MATVKLDPAKGVQIPNLTTTERNAISSPETGALIWNTTTSAINQYNGSAWSAVDTSTDNTKLPLAGGTMTGNLALGDGDILRLGGENDLQIYHDGNNSYIDEQGTGALTIRSNTINLRKYTGETLAEFQADGAVTLRYDNVSKLETTSAGVTVTGEVYGNGGGFRIKAGSATLGGIFKSGTIEGNSNADVTVFAETGKMIHLSANGSATKVLSVSANGLLFNGDTAAANALDDYEEGTWTPTITFSSSAPNVTLGNINAGHYTKIGDTVHFHMTLHVNAYNSGSGNLIIGGLPFAHTSTYTKRFITASLSADHLNWESDWVAVNLTNATGGTTGFTYTAQRDNAASEYIAQANYPTGNTYHFATGHYYTDS
jgi:hypothetical protein